jgi:diadenosine tetraphosphatase ApaH/serine/threonine PP2A family protein phosphatase
MTDLELFTPPKDITVLNLPFPKGRLIAIGDVHGCLEELNSLLAQLQITGSDTVVFLGDLVDRGPDPEGVVQKILHLANYYSFYNVLGNHDEKILRYHYHSLKKHVDPNYKIPMRVNSTYSQMSQTGLEFLAKCPHAIFFDNKGTEELYPVVCVHAGLAPSLFKQDPKAFIRNRYFTKNVKDNKLTPVKSIEINGVWHVPENSYPWSHFWDGRYTVVYGHAVYPQPEIVNNTIGCDGGCCFGGVLRAWVKPSGLNSFFVEIKSNLR